MSITWFHTFYYHYWNWCFYAYNLHYDNSELKSLYSLNRPIHNCILSFNSGVTLILSAIQQSLSKNFPSIEASKAKKKEGLRKSCTVVQEEGNIISLIDLELRKVSISVCVCIFEDYWGVMSPSWRDRSQRGPRLHNISWRHPAILRNYPLNHGCNILLRSKLLPH